MREWEMEKLEQQIDSKKSEVDRSLFRQRHAGRVMRKRSRSKEKKQMLDKLCRQRWKQAELEGKVIYITEREWYYEFD